MPIQFLTLKSSFVFSAGKIVMLVFLIISFFVSCNKPIEVRKNIDQKKPNIILILADDMGYSDLGCYGSEINTPNLDTLATRGLRMTQFYNASRCCPTRASLLTGLYPHQANMGFMQEDCGLPGYGGFIPDTTVTIAQLLKANGYNTAMSGKWHVGNDKAYWPTKKGFDKFYGFPHHGGAYFYPFPGDQVVVLGDSIITPEKDYYSTDAINEYGTKFVEEMGTDEKPFFLYLAHIAPHFPLQAKKEDIAKYLGTYKEGFSKIRKNRYKKQKALGIIASDYPLSIPDLKVPEWKKLSESEKEDYDLRMSIYAAQIETMDRGIGNLIAKLKEIRQFDNTLIVFLSDNGGTREEYSNTNLTVPMGEVGSFGCYTLPWANVSNTPYRMFKHWGNEGGIRTPFIVHYPNMIQETRIDHQPAHIIDLMSTFAELAGVSNQIYNDKKTPFTAGRSLVPIFNKKIREPHEGLYWEHEGNKAARLANWKWVSVYPDYIDELYDLDTDPVESNNLALEFPNQLERIKNKWQHWADEIGVIPWEQVLAKEPKQARLQIYY